MDERMRHYYGIVFVILAISLLVPIHAVVAQTIQRPHESVYRAPSENRVAVLPVDRNLRQDAGLDANLAKPGESVDFKSLLKPRFDFQFEWQPESSDLSLSSYDLSAQMPLYPIFGPPPPMITVGYSLTDIQAPTAFDLPDRLHDVSLGLAWMRRINNQWMARFMVSTAFASDWQNTGSEAWQVRGGGFAIYRPNECWSFAIGALATGQDDMPVVPAIGAIWEPTPEWSVNLMLPNPRISRLIFDTGKRQHWGYVGGGFSGGAWAYERTNGLSDRLEYREWRLLLGWESRPPRPRGSFRPLGTTMNVEVGYVFGRKFEFDTSRPTLRPNDSLLLRTRINF